MRWTLLVIVAISLACMPVASRGETRPTPRGGGSLEERLKAGLRVRAPRDAMFLDTVARRVREGSLPGHLVDSTYLWAVRRGRKHPFPAFEHVIRLQAGTLGVPLDDAPSRGAVRGDPGQVREPAGR